MKERSILLREADLHRGPLVLINREHPLEGGFHGELAELPRRGQSVLMESRAAALLEACIQSVGGAGRIVPVSGWRSRTEQEQIWADSLRDHGEAFTRSYVALPDCSEHQSGLAIDLAKAAEEIDFIRPEFPYDGVCGAFRRSAAKYGFIERYREEKRALTGIAAEPWHFRYVGAPHAVLMDKHNLCLEEYSPFLRRGEQVCVLENGKRARVRYVPWAGTETEVTVAEDCCQISGDNVGGFIVTIWG